MHDPASSRCFLFAIGLAVGAARPIFAAGFLRAIFLLPGNRDDGKCGPHFRLAAICIGRGYVCIALAGREDLRQARACRSSIHRPRELHTFPHATRVARQRTYCRRGAGSSAGSVIGVRQRIVRAKRFTPSAWHEENTVGPARGKGFILVANATSGNHIPRLSKAIYRSKLKGCKLPRAASG
jgi:hypothetical protein